MVHTPAELLATAIVEDLRRRHYDGTGCGTTGLGACSNCFGPSPMADHELTATITAFLTAHHTLWSPPAAEYRWPTPAGRPDPLITTTSTSVTLYPCDRGTGRPAGFHHFQAQPGAVAVCRWCGRTPQ